ncbi:MAG TPA: DUF2244 domain-containing protein [Cellvibrionales bacterium]|nr:DUF2244 domain-containing protein [Cellvibrionales bacterium]
MIKVSRKTDSDDTITTLILSPDRSLDWDGNKRVIWSLGGVCIGIAMGFTIIAGAWVMLPFAGLEVLILSLALYYVSWKLSYRHVLTLSNKQLIIEKGVYRPKGKWVWEKQATRLVTRAPKHDWEAQGLTLINDNEEVNIGDFLSQSDANELIAFLKGEILVTQSFKSI